VAWKIFDVAYGGGRLEESLLLNMSRWNVHSNFASETRWVREGYPPQMEQVYTESFSDGIITQFSPNLRNHTSLNMNTAWIIAIFNSHSGAVHFPFSESTQNSRVAYEYPQTAQLQFPQELVSPVTKS